jgi:hypothetical protein
MLRFAGGILGLLSLNLLLQAQQDPKVLMARVRERVLATVDRLPNYMCTQTIDRAQYAPVKIIQTSSCAERMRWRKRGLEQSLTTSDRLRLDVGVADKREIYSWVGENSFRNRSLSDLVGEGTISNGSFASFLMMIFRADAGDFPYKGKVNEAGRPLAKFGFRVPREKSHYSFSTRKGRSMIAYEGTLLVDPKNVDLVRLVVTGQPWETGICEITTTMDYGRVRLNGSTFLLPAETRLKIVDLGGDEFDNQTVYSSCHEFLGESTLTFEPPLEPATKGRGVASNEAAVELPPGIPFTVTLTQDIDFAVAATGDPITARLATAIRDESATVLVAEGASITGRILRIRRFYGQSALLVLAVKLETLDAGDTRRPFSAAVDPSGPDSAERTGFSIGGWNLGPTTTFTDRGVAVFEFQNTTANPVIRAGLESKWVTTAP